MKTALYIFILTWFLSSCSGNNVGPENPSVSNEVNEKIEYLTEGSKIYTAFDSTNFSIQVSAVKGKIRVDLNLSPVIKLSEQLTELESTLLLAEKEFNLDSIHRVDLGFFTQNPELTLEVSQIPSVRSHLDSCKINNITFLDHQFLAKEILKSNFIQSTIQCFKKYNFIPSSSWLEKCYSSDRLSIEEKNSPLCRDNHPARVLRCANFSLGN